MTGAELKSRGFIVYVDFEGVPHPATLCFEEGDSMTLQYYTGNERSLRAGDVHTAVKVQYKVQHGSHVDHNRKAEFKDEHESLTHGAVHYLEVQARPLTPVINKNSTGFLVKPGNYWLMVDEELPTFRVRCEHKEFDGDRCASCGMARAKQ